MTDPQIADLSYEDARDELTSIVATLEAGNQSLEESMSLWERGEALAQHCQQWLDQAEKRIEAMTAEQIQELHEE
ncbi:exodeoxyribonuclease VII small subunit [Branchiibius hedensis]|uniref:Exodeoxyribonuclease 7 small subunit n=1 Tax=Branchiibius hedensis TaxID=672460 RepID=A0A2Y8ZKW5_9MICO|nr:exodeoxyribonuclease VII small subunit [Branchiibius hedensis]PWJ24244.1 exodeoxyribonuclease VII small subunit [Branchiibius hedensis]SSA33061.1 Exodeoxyribonuclease VII small subunit [Branchiibius hedensis]